MKVLIIEDDRDIIETISLALQIRWPESKLVSTHLGEKGIELVETQWTKGEWATCCGGGGGFEAVFPELSEILAVNRTRELLETGAEIIVTNCPGCVMQLKTGLKELNNNSVEALDLAQVVAMAVEA